MTALVPAANFLLDAPLNPTGRPHMDGGLPAFAGTCFARHDVEKLPGPDSRATRAAMTFGVSRFSDSGY